ncbi:uncharacterized protein LOC143019752 [Oratosquilla oratoria]|uniref:uncharacterized protein LOC143019752 n=1 Tax=Oratosquilla oratoria TaxID=337810 RepID=UPI003F764566
MRNPAGRTPFLLLLGGVLGVWPLLHANSIDVDLELPFCHNDTHKSMVCNYTDATEEVILNAYPTGCNKWKTLKLIGAKSLSVTVSCFGQIIVSSSNELSVTVHTGEDENNPTRSLHILDSNVLSLEGAVGRLYITRSNVASLNVSYVTDLNIVDSSVDSFDSVLNTDHDCLLSNTSIKSLDRLEVSGGKHLNIIGCHIDVLNKMVYSVHAISEMEGGAIHRIVKGGIVVRDGPLVLSNVSIGSLEKEAIVATDDGKLHFMYSSINEAVVDSVFLRKGGSVSLMKTSVTGEQLDFHLKGEAEVYPFSLFEQFRGFSTVSMVWSDFFGALMVLLVTFRVFLALMRRKGRRGPCEFSFPGEKTHLISESSSGGDDTKDTPQGNPPPFAHDVKPDIPTFRTAHERRRLRRRRSSPSLRPAIVTPGPSTA